MPTLELTIPTAIEDMRYKGKAVSLTYNKWIRYPYMTRYKATVAFKESLKIENPPVFERPVKLTFTLKVGNVNKIRDLHGFCSIPDKLIGDWLQDKGCIPDDSLKYVHKSVYQWAEVPNLRNPIVHILVEET